MFIILLFFYVSAIDISYLNEARKRFRAYVFVNVNEGGDYIKRRKKNC
jgi:hypothetical protein